jgi:hypothetical protein
LRLVQRMNAQMICPTPWRIPYRTPAGASKRADALSEKTGRLFEAHACICHFFHVEPLERRPNELESGTE